MRCRIFNGFKTLESVVIDKVDGILYLIGFEVLLCLSAADGKVLHELSSVNQPFPIAE
jgi:hypothetical protein